MEKLKVRGCGWGEKREEVKVRQKKRGEADGGSKKEKGKKKRPAVLASSVSNEYILQDKTVLPER